MAESGVEVIMTPRDLVQRFNRYPQQYYKVMEKTMQASLLHVQGQVPPYPRPRPNQTYRRTGRLGRSLGVSQTGGALGVASINTVRRIGAGYQGEFGTNLSYAPDVIGEGTQRPLFVGRWWTLKTVAKRSIVGIMKLHNAATEQLARWIDGR